ncbi:MAG: hypothetical protein KDJ68_13260 [Rhodobiaceae bacterium]|nr:hypothetical protein [Rhodobiaceae bacterium]
MPRRTIIKVSDHALIRYLERVKKADFRELRAYLGEIGGIAVDHGACSIIADGARLMIRDDHVVTVLERDMETRTVEDYLGRPFRAKP